jgi:hypothetical protein
LFSLGGWKVEGVGVVKEKPPKLEEIEASHTLGGAGGKTVSRGEGRGRSRKEIVNTALKTI